MLTSDGNLALLEELNRQWVQKAMDRTVGKRIILDMDSSESPVHGEQEGSAYNLGNFLRRLALPKSVRHWSLRSLLVKLVKIGAKVARGKRYVRFQMAEVAVSKKLFKRILLRINRLRCCTA